MTTLKDISRRSGFSVTTVSRALNGFEDVTADTRARIAAIARELNYRPNQVARKLVSGRSGMVALVLGAPPKPFEHAHFLPIVLGLSEAFSARDMDFVLHVGAGGDGMTTFDRMIDRGTMDGFILTAPEIDDARITRLIAQDIPFVAHGHVAGDTRYPYYDIDNMGLSWSMVDFVADLGHRRIGLINGPERWVYAAERLRGFRAALAARGLAYASDLVRHGDTSQAYGAQAAAGFFAMGAAAPTAILCCNSLVAAGVYESARAAGLRVPQDVSVVAHDDVLPQIDTARMDPPLTVTLLPVGDAAAPLADLLVRRIAGEPASALQVMHTAQLLPRGSTARVRG